MKKCSTKKSLRSRNPSNSKPVIKTGLIMMDGDMIKLPHKKEGTLSNTELGALEKAYSPELLIEELQNNSGVNTELIS